MPIRRLPSLSALRAFEAAARRLSFKEAASELAVTPGAVSQQIKGLEEDLGVLLFERATRSISMSEAGRYLQPEVTEAFLRIRQAVDHVRPDEAKTLRISSFGPVVSKWLLPRLHRFTEHHPKLRVNVETDLMPNALQNDGPDVSIRCVKRLPDALFGRKLHEEVLVPVASPEFIERFEVKEPEDVFRVPLIHDTSLRNFDLSPAWETWVDEAGFKKPPPKDGVNFPQGAADHAIEATIGGTGMMVGRSLLIFGPLTEGRLTCPFGPALKSGLTYYVTCRRGREKEEHISHFMHWAVEEAAITSTLQSLLHCDG